jgi:hypothetical protein
MAVHYGEKEEITIPLVATDDLVGGRILERVVRGHRC